MSYIVPSPQVYQQLQNSGGVANSTPDLESCVIGPAYNILRYTAGSTVSLVATAALSSVTTTGSIASASTALTVVATGGFSVNDSVLVIGAGLDGSNLQATITDITGNVITLNSTASTTVTGAVVSKSGSITNPLITNTFTLPGQKPGQVIDTASVQIWLNNASVQSLVTGGRGYADYNIITVNSPATTGSITSGQSTLTVTNAKGFIEGDQVTVVGAGAAGALLTATIVTIAGSVFTISSAAGTTVSGAAVTKVAPSNVNSVTNTLRCQPGDTLKVAYTNNAAVSKFFNTVVQSVVTSSGLNGTITSITTTDVMPSDLGVQTTGSVTTGTATLTVASATGLNIGDNIVVYGAGASGADLVTTISNIVGSTVTLGSNASTTVASAVVKQIPDFTVYSIQAFNNQQLPLNKPLTSGLNYDVSSTGTTGEVDVEVSPEVVYGLVLSADVHIQYKALRTDLAGTIHTFNNVSDVEATLGEISDDNPLALGLQLALANTTGRVFGIGIDSNDLTGHLSALELSETFRLYCLSPLTQDTSILAAYKAHVAQMSTPENASWRILLANTAMPTTQNIGPYSASYVNANGGNNNIAVNSGKYVLTASNATFISDGVVPGDVINVTAATPSTIVGTLTVQEVISNQQVVVSGSTTATAISYYVTRSLTKTQVAQSVASTSEGFGLNRVVHVQPDIVGVSVSGATKYLPGYYLCAALSGMVSGFPVQQGFTNIGVAGIVDLKHSNFYFSKADMNTMAESGTFLFMQETQGGMPYCRHELTTDMSTLEYRELLVVKNWDYLSYFYYDKLKPFIGSWNITKDTLNIIRQTFVSSSELLKSKKLPKIGAPLLGYQILKLEQNAVNKDHIDCEIKISVVYPNNYTNIYLII